MSIPMYRWEHLPWETIERNVFKLQKRIYRASQRGDVKAVHSLQKLLMKSWSAGAEWRFGIPGGKPELLKKIQAQVKAPLKDAVAVNATRWELLRRLQALGLPIECGSGGLTKYNRARRGIPKAHWLDAACVGKSTPEHIDVTDVVPLAITASGHGCRQMCLMDANGFPRTNPKQKKFKHGFKTGDIVRAIVPPHLKNGGTHIGRMSAKASGSFTIVTKSGAVTDMSKNSCQKLQRADGYGFSHLRVSFFPPIS